MQRILLCLFALCTVATLSACSSTSTSSTASNTATGGATAGAVAQAEEDDPLVCETYIPAGTRVGRKVCIRQSEKDRIRENAQLITQETQRRAVIQGNPTGN